MVGTTISHYRVLEKLGEGGMGVVYRAEDTRLERIVALKFLATHLTSDEQVNRRFSREAKAAAALDHPNVCTVFEVDEVDGQTFIAMSFLEGGSLEDRIKNGPLRLEDALDFGAQIAQGLKAAHDQEVVHRDIKPGNVMIGKDGYLKLMDFGLALLSNRSRLTQSDSTVGTPAYMSPEQARGQLADLRTDIWSLGVVLYEMVVGHPPFDSSYQQAIIYSILNDEAEPVTALRTGVPMQLEWIIDKCMAKDPEERYQSAGEVVVDLLAMRRRMSTPGMSRQSLPNASRPYTTSSTTTTLTMQPAAAPPAPKRLPIPIVAAIGALCAVLGAGALWLAAGQTGASSYRFTQLTFDDGLTFEPAISPDASLVAYASDRSGVDLDLWVQQTAGGQPLRLTNHPADDREPHFSPDGQNIVFRSERDGGGVYLVSALGGQERLIAARGWRPRFSPDGRFVVYHEGASGYTGDIRTPGSMTTYIIDASGANRRRLRDDFDISGFPIWAGGSKAVVVWGCPKDRLGDFGAWRVPIDGGTPEQLYRGSMLTTLSWPSGDSDVFVVYPRWFGVLSVLRHSAWSGWRRDHIRPLTQGTDSVWSADRADNGTIAYSPVAARIDLWSLTTDGQEQTSAVPHRLTNDFARESQPTSTRDGRSIVYRSRRASSDLWLNDPVSGELRRLTVGAESEHWPVLSKDGASLYFRVFDDQSRRQVYRISTNGSPRELVAPDMGNPTAITADERYLIGMQRVDGRMAATVFDLQTKQTKNLAAHPSFSVYSPRLSSDEQWICFQARHPDDTVHIYVVPFRSDGQPVEEDRWIPITTGTNRNRKAIFSTDDDLIYFVSDRDGFDCIWSQALSERSKEPAGPPTAVRHFHQTTVSLSHVEEAEQQIAVGANQLIYNAAEIRGNVWLMTPTE